MEFLSQMINRNLEMERLHHADAQIAKGEVAVTRQYAILRELQEVGHDTREAERQLHDFQNIRAAMFTHRIPCWR